MALSSKQAKPAQSQQALQQLDDAIKAAAAEEAGAGALPMALTSAQPTSQCEHA
jgi:hypothetical protein